MNPFYFISGDWPFLFSEQLRQFSWFPHVFQGGWQMGENLAYRLWIEYFFQIIVKILTTLGLSWFFIDLFFIGLIAVVTVYSSWRLSRKFFTQTYQSIISVLVYCINTYFFMIFGGGQLGVALGVGLLPLVFSYFIDLVGKPKVRSGIRFSAIFSFLVAIDLRIAYIACVIFFFYSFWHLPTLRKWIGLVLVSFFCSMLLHLYWIIPFLLSRSSSIPQEYTNALSLSFFSFADFSHALALLHPNWPENLFGRIYFLQPEFLLLPILAFAALLTVNKKRSEKDRGAILFFSLAGLVGIFLAKGVNPPFGQIYEWLFTKMPGFFLFRDPIKFYTIIALSYAILIPYTLSALVGRLKKSSLYVTIFFVLLQCVFFRSIIGGKAFRNFLFLPVPKDYTQLKNTLVSDTTFSRTLWLPTSSKFMYFDQIHPFTDAQTVFNESSISGIIRHLQDKNIGKTLGNTGIGYIIVPTDEGKGIFLNDYVYDEKLRQQLIRAVDNTPFTRLGSYGQIAVYAVPHPRDLFSTPQGDSMTFRTLGINSFELPAIQNNTIVMLYAYDPHWVAKVGTAQVYGAEYSDGWTQFALPDSARGKSITISYDLDPISRNGLLASCIIAVILGIIYIVAK